MNTSNPETKVETIIGSLTHVYYGEKAFGLAFFLQMLYPFKARQLGSFLAHERQYGRMGLVYFVAYSRVSFSHETSIKSERLQNRSIFFPSSRALRAVIVKRGYSVQSSAIFWVIFVVTSKSNTRIRHLVKKKAISLFVLVSRVIETLRSRHKVNSAHSSFADVLIFSTRWNDLFCSRSDDVSIWWLMFNFVFLSLRGRFQFNSKIVRSHFASVMTLNNWEMIAETRSYIFRWRPRCRRHRRCFLIALVANKKRRM